MPNQLGYFCPILIQIINFISGNWPLPRSLNITFSSFLRHYNKPVSSYSFFISFVSLLFLIPLSKLQILEYPLFIDEFQMTKFGLAHEFQSNPIDTQFIPLKYLPSIKTFQLLIFHLSPTHTLSSDWHHLIIQNKNVGVILPYFFLYILYLTRKCYNPIQATISSHLNYLLQEPLYWTSWPSSCLTQLTSTKTQKSYNS